MRIVALIIVITVALLTAQSVTVEAGWASPINLSNTPGFFTGSQRFVFDSSGNLHFCYSDFLDTDLRIYYGNNIGGTFNSSFVTNGGDAILVMTPQDQMLYLFYKYNSGMWVRTKPASGGSWSGATRLDTAIASSYIGDAVVDSSGGIYFAYLTLFKSEYNPPSAIWGRYKPYGGSWGATELVCGYNNDNFPSGFNLTANGTDIWAAYNYNGVNYPRLKVRSSGVWGTERNLGFSGGGIRIAFSSTGEVAIAYGYDPPGEDQWYQVFARFSNDGGATFGPEINLSYGPWLNRIPEICYDANGNFHCAYQRKDFDSDDFDMWYTARINGSWLWTHNLTNDAERSGAPMKAIFARGNDLYYTYTNTVNGFEDAFLMTNPYAPDTTAPAPVTQFAANPSDAKVYLSWRNPSDMDYVNTIIRYRNDTYPMSPTDGTLLLQRRTKPGDTDSYIHTPVVNGSTYYYAVYTVDPYNNYSAAVTGMATPVSMTCGLAKYYPDGSTIDMLGKVVTAVFPSESCIYVQDIARSSGIRVAYTGTSLAVGDVVNINGTIGTRYFGSVASERAFTSATVTKVSSGAPPPAAAMNCRTLGGAPAGAGLIPGVKNGTGVNSIGLLARIHGKVTYAAGSVLYVDDGSKIENLLGLDTPMVGVMVKGPTATSAYAVGSYVRATGIIAGSVPTGWTTNRSYLQVRDWADVVTLAGAPLGSLSGTVRDSSNAPISGASVVTTPGGYSATTAADGSYSIQSMEPNTYSVTASKTGYASSTQTGVVVSAYNNTVQNFNLTATAGTISGTVTDGSGTGVVGATVSTNTGGYSTTTGAGGAYTISNVTPGSYNVTASKSGYSPATQSGVTVSAGATSTVNLQITALPGSISGFVRDTSNNPISGATVSTNTGGYSTTSAADGSYTLSGVAAGTYNVTASKSGYVSSTQNNITVSPGQAVTGVNFALSLPPGTITGTVKDQANNGVVGATVSTNTGGYATTTGAGGAYTLANVAPGTYTVTASKSGYLSGSQTGVNVTSGGTTTVNLIINLNVGTISGTVLDASNNPLSGATVSTNTGGYSTTTNASGQYTLSNVAVGTYDVTASKSGYISQTHNSVSVLYNQTTTVNFNLSVQPIERVSNGAMEGGFYNTGWASSCSNKTSQLPNPSANGWGWNNDTSYPFNTWDSASVKHAGSHALGISFCQTASSPGKMGIIWQSVYLGAPNASATFSVWAYHTNGNCPSIMCWNPGQNQNSPETAYSSGTRYQWVTTDNWGQLNQWVTRSMTVTADGTGYVTIMVGGAAHPGTTSGAAVYIDDVSVLN